MEIVYSTIKIQVDHIIDSTWDGAISEINLNDDEYGSLLHDLDDDGIQYDLEDDGSFQYRDVYFYLKSGV
jgi:hypothetical protein